MNRRYFIQLTVTFGALGAFFSSCKLQKKIKGKIKGASAHIGHMLRDKNFTEPVSVMQKKIVIVGGGVSGLSAAYHLQKAGFTDFLLLDLQEKTGGNSTYDSNNISAFPWGAHYVPIPNNSLVEYQQFLKEADVITGYTADGLPIYNELYLCFDPEERLYINGQWQEGLVPHFGVPPDEQKQIERFLALMNGFRYKKGRDGKEAFALPVDSSSKDEEFVALDKVTMEAWMKQQDFTSPHLLWYVNYCTKDDFGTPIDKVSAWAGIHYYASRKGKGANAEHQDVLTWPEGNGWLIQQLEKKVLSNIQTASLVTQIKPSDGGISIHYFDVNENQLKAIDAEQCILAVPQFIASRLLQDELRKEAVNKQLHYVPWMVANLSVAQLEERNGAPPSWDNVIYDSDSLGYVVATHQFVQQHIPNRNLTYYLPLIKEMPGEARKLAQNTTYEQWTEKVMADLKRIHPNINDAVQEVNVQVWGHAMVQPLPGLIHGNIRKELSQSLYNCVHFAHTDVAGVSLFEEGFYQGLNAAKKTIQNLTA